MNQLDGLIENEYIVTIATTNDAKKIEEALKNRPGRFDRIIEIPKPSEEDRKKMFKYHIGDCILDDINLDLIAEKTAGYTGAHVKELVTTAIITAIETRSLNKDEKIILKQQHFEQNIEKVGEKKVRPVGFRQPIDADESYTPDELEEGIDI